MATYLAITGWIAAAFLALVLHSCRIKKHGWRKLYKQARASLDLLEREKRSDEMDRQWYREENTRLRLKCDAICAQIRRMKGRGMVTCEMHPQRHF